MLATDSRRIISGQLVYSNLGGKTLTDRLIAGRLQLNRRSFQFGVSIAQGGLRAEPEEKGLWDITWMAGTDLRVRDHNREFLVEFAVQKENATAKTLEVVWPLSDGRFHARAWSYGAGYSNPWGGGPGHADTRIVSLDDIEETFSSRTSGERGFDFTTRIAATPNINLRWDWMSHREEPGANLEHSGVFRAEIRRPAFRTTPFIRAQIDEDETESYSLGNYLWWGPEERELNLRAEFGTHYDDEVQFIRLGLGAKVQINRVVRFAPAIRWIDPNLDISSDGYWYFYFTETVLPIDGARVEMALVWKQYENSTKDDLVELRVRGFVK
jgi:hypothetical protein